MHALLPPGEADGPRKKHRGINVRDMKNEGVGVCKRPCH
jgi:hypothetical protein